MCYKHNEIYNWYWVSTQLPSLFNAHLYGCRPAAEKAEHTSLVHTSVEISLQFKGESNDCLKNDGFPFPYHLYILESFPESFMKFKDICVIYHALLVLLLRAFIEGWQRRNLDCGDWEVTGNAVWFI